VNQEHDLIARVISSGDQHAFETLVKKYQVAVRQFLRRLTAGDHASADDIAQECFFKVYQKLDTFLGHSSFNTWLHKIAYNCFLKHQQKVYHQHELNNFDFSAIQTTTKDSEKDIIIERLMVFLEPTERTCVTLSVSVGMSHQEIVAVTGLPLGTVKSHLLRGKQKLIDKVNSKTRSEDE
jgi:RNA polymerase sigma-70 factor, ECF subfamily